MNTVLIIVAAFVLGFVFSVACGIYKRLCEISANINRIVTSFEKK